MAAQACSGTQRGRAVSCHRLRFGHGADGAIQTRALNRCPIATPLFQRSLRLVCAAAALSFTAIVAAEGPIIINHTSVDKYDTIPACWLTTVKTMLLNYPGESHGRGLPYGLDLLAVLDNRFAVHVVWSGAPEESTDEHLRVFLAHFTGASWSASAGEEDTWTHPAAVDRINNHLTYCASALGNSIDAFAWAWCWDMEWQSDGCDENGWAGRVYTDFAKTTYTDYWDIESTSPCLLDYLTVWAGYVAGHPNSAIVYTTGPADGATGCKGYQRWLKNNAIRDWVAASEDDHVFDYEDILCHNDAGELYTVTWEGHEYPRIHPANAGSYDGGHGGCHIGENGCLRLGKAAWVLMARVAGWDGMSLGDFDRDCDVDFADFEAFSSLCLTGPTSGCPDECWIFDFDDDSDADMVDLGRFQLAFGTVEP